MREWEIKIIYDNGVLKTRISDRDAFGDPFFGVWTYNFCVSKLKNRKNRKTIEIIVPVLSLFLSYFFSLFSPYFSVFFPIFFLFLLIFFE